MSKVARRCACRGILEADDQDPVEIVRVVQDHQQSPRHRDWWARSVIAGDYLLGPKERVERFAGKPVPRLVRKA